MSECRIRAPLFRDKVPPDLFLQITDSFGLNDELGQFCPNRSFSKIDMKYKATVERLRPVLPRLADFYHHNRHKYLNQNEFCNRRAILILRHVLKNNGYELFRVDDNRKACGKVKVAYYVCDTETSNRSDFKVSHLKTRTRVIRMPGHWMHFST